MKAWLSLVWAVLAVACAGVDASPGLHTAQSIKTARLRNSLAQVPVRKREAQITFPNYTFTQPLDHFNDTGYTFEQYYWVSDRHYKKGGPVIVFEAGEGPGDERFPILDTGIVDILANATNGLGVILEHRYYGYSIPVQNFSTDSLRWLNNEQAAADSANFISNVQFPGIDDNLTAPGTPWIYYGGSYGGARAAQMKVLYPDIVYGAISSSGVSHAAINLWEYFDVVRTSAPENCTNALHNAIVQVDNLITQSDLRTPLKALFGLANLTDDADFASLLSSPLGIWQELNWDPAVSTTAFDEFCDALTQSTDNATIAEGVQVDGNVVNLANYINQTYASQCTGTLDECYGTDDDSAFQDTDLSQTWRAWQFQVCTQWGFFMPAPPKDVPKVVSDLLTLNYTSKICTQAYPPGEYFQVPAEPDVESVNKLGGYHVAADRLAIINGGYDPWRPATPDSSYVPGLNRTDTILQPFKLIPKAVHHWDENGLADRSQEPPDIQAIHAQEVKFVTAWLEDFGSSS